MSCVVCRNIPYSAENDCFERALDAIKKHYAYYKNTVQQQDLELQQVKERNEKLNKALQLLQKNQHSAKRFKSHQSDDTWSRINSSQENRAISEVSLTDDEAMGDTNLNVALNSEQLFDTSSLDQSNDASIISSSEMLQNHRDKESPKRNKQHNTARSLKYYNNKCVRKSKSEWHTKERNCSGETSWAMQFLLPTKIKPLDEKVNGEGKKAVDKKLSLSLKKTNPSKMKQSIIHFNNSKDINNPESYDGVDIIDASPAIVNKSMKIGRSWAQRSGSNYNSNNDIKEPIPKVDTCKILDDIVFDFSPSKKTDYSENVSCSKNVVEPKKLEFDSMSKESVSLPNEDLRVSTDKSDSSSVVILTPGSQDIIFVDDTCNEPEIDTMDLLADVLKPESTDNLAKLKTYENKCIEKQQSKETDLFKKPSNVTNINIKQEKITQKHLEEKEIKKAAEEKPSCSKSDSRMKIFKPQNPLVLLDEQDTEDDEDFMPKPFIIKEEPESSKTSLKLSIKQRFNIDCEDCEKLINFLGERLTVEQIQEHLKKCKRHNNPDIMRQNTPTDFWNPFILSFLPDDPRNEVLIDKRFKDNKE